MAVMFYTSHMSMTYLVYPTFQCMQHGLTGNHNMQGFSGFGNGKIQHILSSKL